MTDRVGQVIKRNQFTAGEDCRAFQSILQLTDIAEPSFGLRTSIASDPDETRSVRLLRLVMFLCWRRSVALVQFEVDLQHVDHFLANQTAHWRERVGLQDLIDLIANLSLIALGIRRPF